MPPGAGTSVPPELEPPEVLPPEVLPPVVVVVVLVLPPVVLPPVVLPPEVLLPPLEVLLLLLDLLDLVDFVDLVDLVDLLKNDLVKVDLVVVLLKSDVLVDLKKNAFASDGVTAATEVVATAAETIAAFVSFRYCICPTLFT